MSVTEILAAVRKLGEKDKNEFLTGLGEIDFHDAWDHQIDTDIKAGKLDGLAEEALAEHRSGKTRPLRAPFEVMRPRNVVGSASLTP